jgi:hypothetical protein
VTITTDHLLGGATGVAIYHVTSAVWNWIASNGGWTGILKTLKFGKPTGSNH